MSTLKAILLLIAFVCFIIAAFASRLSWNIHIGWLGLAAWALAELTDGLDISSS